MFIKIIFAIALAIVFAYRVIRDSSLLTNQLIISSGEHLYYEALNGRVFLSLILWIAGIIYWSKPSMIVGIILYELAAYIVIISLSFVVYRFYNGTKTQSGDK